MAKPPQIFDFMKTLFLSLLFIIPTALLSQPASGIKAGANLTWFDKDDTDREYSPALGYHLGYAWRIKCSPKVSISIESMFNRKSVMKEWDAIYNIGENTEYSSSGEIKENAYYVSAPLGVNYMINNRFYVSGGYEFGYSLYDLLGGDRLGPTYDHAGYVGAGFHMRYFDFVVRYAHTFNTEIESYGGHYLSPTGEEVHSRTYDFGKSRTLQFSVILSFGGKKGKD